ncbi:MAG: SDR family NAD(P)-dependent oxidoreductase [Anaerolineae bacterium]|nr:SDR family NAD(P)-dependent oxidoreductase [Anaerolineae bacterium]
MPEALIWGASGGIGQALVAALKRDGWRVFAAARNTQRIPPEADCTYGFDVSDTQSFKEAATLLAHDVSGLDLIVYAAGALRAEMLKRMRAEDWAEVLASNLTGAFLAASYGVHLLKPEGHMMFIGAYIDHVTLPKMGAYAAAKAGLETMVEVLRAENRRLRFSVVRPGAVDTPFWEHAPFRRPTNARAPAVIAEAILAHYHAADAGDLNL